MLSAGVVAPAFAADPPVIPADLPPPKADAKRKTVAAAKKPAAKPAPADHKSGDANVIVLPHPEPAVVSQKNVNVRGQALLNSEIVAHLKKGDRISVLRGNHDESEKGRAGQVAQDRLPPGSSVWVNSSADLTRTRR